MAKYHFDREVSKYQWRHNERDGVSNHTSVSIVYSTVFFRRWWKKDQSSATLAFLRAIRRWPVNSSHKGPEPRKNVSIWWRHHEFTMLSNVNRHLQTLWWPHVIVQNDGGTFKHVAIAIPSCMMFKPFLYIHRSMLYLSILCRAVIYLFIYTLPPYPPHALTNQILPILP